MEFFSLAKSSLNWSPVLQEHRDAWFTYYQDFRRSIEHRCIDLCFVEENHRSSVSSSFVCKLQSTWKNYRSISSLQATPVQCKYMMRQWLEESCTALLQHWRHSSTGDDPNSFFDLLLVLNYSPPALPACLSCLHLHVCIALLSPTG